MSGDSEKSNLLPRCDEPLIILIEEGTEGVSCTCGLWRSSPPPLRLVLHCLGVTQDNMSDCISPPPIPFAEALVSRSIGHPCCCTAPLVVAGVSGGDVQTVPAGWFPACSP